MRRWRLSVSWFSAPQPKKAQRRKDRAVGRQCLRAPSSSLSLFPAFGQVDTSGHCKIVLLPSHNRPDQLRTHSRPGTGVQGSNASGLAEQPIPGVTTGVDDLAGGVENAVREPIVSEMQP